MTEEEYILNCLMPQTALRATESDFAPHPSPSPYPGPESVSETVSELSGGIVAEVWSMALVGTLNTAWTDPDGKPVSVKDILPVVQEEIYNCPTDQYEILGNSMYVHGQTVPVRIFSTGRTLRDGIHRIAIAEQLGWNTITVSTVNSSWHEWDMSEDGLEYHRLWRARLGVKGGQGLP